jgi:hypothetical protein
MNVPLWLDLLFLPLLIVGIWLIIRGPAWQRYLVLAALLTWNTFTYEAGGYLESDPWIFVTGMLVAMLLHTSRADWKQQQKEEAFAASVARAEAQMTEIDRRKARELDRRIREGAEKTRAS